MGTLKELQKLVNKLGDGQPELLFFNKREDIICIVEVWRYKAKGKALVQGLYGKHGFLEIDLKDENNELYELTTLSNILENF